MIQKLTCTIPSSLTSYDIEIKHGLLHEQKLLAHYLKPLGTKFALITDDKVADLYGNAFCKMLSSNGLEIYVFPFPSGEQNKSRLIKEKLEDAMFDKGLSRDTCLIAMGGGVASDIGSYVAATYCRGLPLVIIPTTLLCMVDASIGGKTGINVPQGKNMLGCIYQPKKILIDPDTLQTLPVTELRNGFVEMIKHGLIGDATYFEQLEEHPQKCLTLDTELIQMAILESCRIKKDIVQEDEKEKGKRRLLNFGHTIGHALESVMEYTIPHGEAVAIGILVESHIALQLGHLTQLTFSRIQRILKQYSIPLKLPHFPLSKLEEAMSLDKKSQNGKPRFVIIEDIGKPMSFDSEYCTHVDQKCIHNALKWFQNDMHRH